MKFTPVILGTRLRDAKRMFRLNCNNLELVLKTSWYHQLSTMNKKIMMLKVNTRLFTHRIFYNHSWNETMARVTLKLPLLVYSSLLCSFLRSLTAFFWHIRMSWCFSICHVAFPFFISISTYVLQLFPVKSLQSLIFFWSLYHSFAFRALLMYKSFAS